MSIRLAVISCAWALAVQAHSVHAQPPAPPSAGAAHSARDPAARVPATSYSSAYTGYRSWRDEPPASWRAANDEAARIGGHIGMFGGGAGTAPATPGAAAKPAPQHHHGHGGMK